MKKATRQRKLVSGQSTIRGIRVEILVEAQSQHQSSSEALIDYHRSRARMGLDDWREGETGKHPRLWTNRDYQPIPYRSHKALMKFDQQGGDIRLEALAAICTSENTLGLQETSLVSGDFIIRHGMRVVASSWGMAWWDELRTGTSYAAAFEMIKRVRIG
ncbi:MAG: hypothetical protein KF696_01105 [Planctomycetes bacterium]|nr:hypothetical protein [Planctomycetota bacterium]MCW8134462.1 hypothetical protein [Planctomycetota bacterium]